jgi:fluoride exporter
MTLALVAAAAACGAVARFVIDHAVIRLVGSAFPWGTFAVNVTGSFALGLLVGATLAQETHGVLPVVIGTGFLGAYTTFSTWMVQTLRLIEERAWGPALGNAVGSWAAGTGAVVAGLWIAALLR